MSDGLDAKGVAALLAERIATLAPRLLPQGQLVQGRYWRAGSLAGEPGQSLCVWLVGSRRGRWKDFANPELRGDALDLVAATCTGEDLAAAIRWARRELGL